MLIVLEAFPCEVVTKFVSSGSENKQEDVRRQGRSRENDVFGGRCMTLSNTKEPSLELLWGGMRVGFVCSLCRNRVRCNGLGTGVQFLVCSWLASAWMCCLQLEMWLAHAKSSAGPSTEPLYETGGHFSTGKPEPEI